MSVESTILKQIRSLVESEYQVIRSHINLNGSGNYPYGEVLEALRSPVSINPGEGFRGRRYFAKCQNLDRIEELAEASVLNYFQLDPADWGANLQPHSGTQANQAVMFGLLKQAPKVLALNGKSGGHISHLILPELISELHEYDLHKDGTMNLDSIEAGLRGTENSLVIIGGSSYPLDYDYAGVSALCKQYGAYLLADLSHTAAFVATDALESPFPWADFVTFTTQKTFRGPRGGVIMYRKEYEKRILRSIFPIVQAAPKFNEIFAKVTAIELMLRDREEYVQRVFRHRQIFLDTFLARGIDVLFGTSANHLLIIGTDAHGYSGQELQTRFAEHGILANKNSIPNDQRPPWIASGIRFGFMPTATLGISDQSMRQLASYVCDLILKVSPTPGIIERITQHYVLPFMDQNYPHTKPYSGLTTLMAS
ncbi:MAG TPA: hypothetical protein DCE41_32550 [Cytophagales bacterium]|nr:hypothetical protein [Cytophagales bacterium]HAA22843.1 hypothetical protein [Cytophagales bacterium]HAP61240.1 hypothetical protein [Cytophagales bacterium]